MKTKAFSILLLLLLYSQLVHAQRKADAPTEKDTRPKKITIMSAIVPGLGQVYNNPRRAWKIPIIYGAGAFFVRQITQFDPAFHEFRVGLNLRLDDDPTTELFPELSTNEIRFNRDRFRRQRDVNYIFIAVLYLVNIIDANIDAHFHTFKVNKEAIMSFAPHIDTGYNLSNPALGVTLNVKLL